MTTRAILFLSIVAAILLLLARASVPTAAWSEKIDSNLLAATAGGDARARLLDVEEERARRHAARRTERTDR